MELPMLSMTIFAVAARTAGLSPVELDCRSGTQIGPVRRRLADCGQDLAKQGVVRPGREEYLHRRA